MMKILIISWFIWIGNMPQ